MGQILLLFRWLSPSQWLFSEITELEDAVFVIPGHHSLSHPLVLTPLYVRSISLKLVLANNVHLWPATGTITQYITVTANSLGTQHRPQTCPDWSWCGTALTCYTHTPCNSRLSRYAAQPQTCPGWRCPPLTCNTHAITQYTTDVKNTIKLLVLTSNSSG